MDFKILVAGGPFPPILLNREEAQIVVNLLAMRDAPLPPIAQQVLKTTAAACINAGGPPIPRLATVVAMLLTAKSADIAEHHLPQEE